MFYRINKDLGAMIEKETEAQGEPPMSQAAGSAQARL